MSSILAGIPSFKDAFTSSPYPKQKIESLVSVLEGQGYNTSFFHGDVNGSMGFLGFGKILGIDNYYGSSSWFSNYSEQFKHTHIIGGLFGGNKNFVLDLCTDFNNLIGNILNDGYLTLEEEVLSILFSTKYHQYNYLSFKTWYHDIPTDPNYFGLDSTAESFYKIFLNTT